MGVFRAYFYDAKTNLELKDHPCNGMNWLGTSGNIHQDGEFVRGTCDAVTVARSSSLRHITGEQRLTVDDFDRPVVVKIWGPESVDWRLLARDGVRLTEDQLQQAVHLALASTYG